MSHSCLLRSRCAHTGLRSTYCAHRAHPINRGRLHVAATAQPDSEPTTPPQQPTLPTLQQPPAIQQTTFNESFNVFVQRYEGNALASGVGALAVTSWCVAHGQDPLTAAGISVAATIMALVLNEVLFADDASS